MSRRQEHGCLGGVASDEPSWWAHDARGIPLCRVCDRCERQKLRRYNPWVLTGYNEGDVDEPIEGEP